MNSKSIILFILFLITLSSMSSQVKRGEELDKIIAIVGDEIIMKSEIDGRLIMMAQRNPEFDFEDPEAREQILNDLIDEKLLIAKAELDSIEATQEEIDMQWENFKQRSIQQYGSEKRMEQVYGMSLYRLKFELKDQIKNQIVSQKLRQQKFQDLSVTRREVEEFYNTMKDSLPTLPERLELYHIVKNVEPDTSARTEALELAKAVRDSIINGADFTDMAQKYSQDPGSAPDGGNLGWIDKGKLVPEFERAAFSLQLNETSLPVESPFGFHIIQTLDKRENAVNTRHILIRLQQSTDDNQKAKDFLMDIADRIRKSDTTFEEFAKMYSDDKQTKGFGGLIGKVSVQEMSPEMAEVINSMEVGDISEPLIYGNDPTNPAFHILYIKSVIPPHEPNLEDDYEMLEEQALMMKQYRVFNEWMEELRSDLFWEIKE